MIMNLDHFIYNSFSFVSKIADGRALPNQLGFNHPLNSAMEGLINLHHDICFILLIILMLVLWLLFKVVYYFSKGKNNVPSKTAHGFFLEFLWTVTPSLILFAIAIPSFALLYSSELLITPKLTVKVIGNQWYWVYEYLYTWNPISPLITPLLVKNNFGDSSETPNVEWKSKETDSIESYMKADDDLTNPELRLLEVDNSLKLPTETEIRFIVTSQDVLHSWAVPSLGIKIDAVPGRLNQVSSTLDYVGTYYGQCSELCGIKHGFMPIVIEGVLPEKFFFESFKK